ncbi:hypothetical protein CapIbe_009787 [Capra ibex]
MAQPSGPQTMDQAHEWTLPMAVCRRPSPGHALEASSPPADCSLLDTGPNVDLAKGFSTRRSPSWAPTQRDTDRPRTPPRRRKEETDPGCPEFH